MKFDGQVFGRCSKLHRHDTQVRRLRQDELEPEPAATRGISARSELGRAGPALERLVETFGEPRPRAFLDGAFCLESGAGALLFATLAENPHYVFLFVSALATSSMLMLHCRKHRIELREKLSAALEKGRVAEHFEVMATFARTAKDHSVWTACTNPELATHANRALVWLDQAARINGHAKDWAVLCSLEELEAAIDFCSVMSHIGWNPKGAPARRPCNAARKMQKRLMRVRRRFD